MLLRHSRSAGFEPQIVREGNNVQSALQMVSAGIGVAFVPETFRRLFAIQVEYRPLVLEKSPLELYLAWRRDNRSPILEAFVEMFRGSVRPVRREEFNSVRQGF
jgi:DNA-binding transcriptional LysR family regulator